MFAKIYDSEEFGQILITKDLNDDGNPCVKVVFQPYGFGLCGPCYSFTDDDDGFDRRDLGFEGLTLDKLEPACRQIVEMLK